MWPFKKYVEFKKLEEPEKITFSAADNDFVRARKMLRYSGLMNADRCGIASGVAEVLGIYRELDEQYQSTRDSSAND